MEELKVYRDTVNAMGTVCEAQMEIPLETEILIPDYLPAVFKIVKTLVHRVVLQRQLQAGRLQVEGYFRVEVLYQGEDQNLCAVEQKVAFSKQQDVRAAEETAAAIMDLHGEVQYLHCRAVSQRRLDVRGAYDLFVHVMGDHRQELITALSEGGIRQKTLSVPALRVCATQEKQFTLEEPIHFEAPIEQVLHVQCAPQTQEVRVVAGKAIAKGEARLMVLYRAQGGQILCEEKALPFNQVLELEDAQDGCECQALIEPVGCSVFSEGGEEEGTKISCSCLITVRALRTLEAIGVADCFSTLTDVQTEYCDLVTDTLLETVANSVEVTFEGEMPQDVQTVLACITECSAPQLLPEGERTAVRGKAVAHLICRNALGEIDCYDKTEEYTLPKRYELPLEELTASLSACCEGVHLTHGGAHAQVQLTVRTQGFLCRKQHSRLVAQAHSAQALEKDDAVALRVYYACAGEEVFDIAKRYHAAPEDISALAGMEGDVLTADTRLLIPQGQ